MKIKKIFLRNIRSYKEGELELPNGSLLLSGDIGSGKSSILLAIEFALFGLQRGISGNSLLRNGEKNGNVRIEFETDNKKVIIERALKRSKEGVQQDDCSISINGEKKQLSAIELRSTVLSLLSYPSEFLTKNPILYRYTVYTPQEEMKTILSEDADIRLNTLRRVFGIDKYKRIIENTEKVMTKLREAMKDKEGRISDLEKKKTEKEENKKELLKLKTEIATMKLKIEEIKKIIDERKRVMAELETKTKELNILKTEIASISAELKIKEEELERNRKDEGQLEKQIKEAEKEFGGRKFDANKIKEIEKEIHKNENELRNSEKEYLEICKKIASLENAKERAEKIISDISKLNFCPMCKQNVSVEHKKEITNKTNEEIEEKEEELKSISEKKKILERKIEETKNQINDIKKQDKELNVLKIKFSTLEEKRISLEKLQDTEKQFENRKIFLSNKKNEIEEKIDSFKNLEKKHEAAKNMLEEAREEEKQFEILKAKNERQSEDIGKLLSKLEQEITEKEKIKAELGYLSKLKSWLSTNFIPIVSEIEKAVMSKVHSEFSQLFGKWFKMLAEGLDARIDEEFTPIVEQQGYEIEYPFLSGGERTAAALAYRLALNQVVNSLMSQIKTRDILILDEPTDGFSSEQLDKMRDVLQELKVEQLILVSHESKIENFVDNVIKFEKDEVTKIFH